MDDLCEVELKVTVHAPRFDSTETLSEFADRIEEEITDQLRSGEFSAGISIVGTPVTLDA